MSKKKWIQEALKGSKHAWSLSAMLDIPKEKNIPMTLLKKIVKTSIGKTITNPTSTGKKRIKITRKLKQKAIFAHNVKKSTKEK